MVRGDGSWAGLDLSDDKRAGLRTAPPRALLSSVSSQPMHLSMSIPARGHACCGSSGTAGTQICEQESEQAWIAGARCDKKNEITHVEQNDCRCLLVA